MSDLRDFTPRTDDAGPRFIAKPVNDVFPNAKFVDSGGLGEFHVAPEVEETGSRRAKWMAGAAVALVFGAAGAYAVTTYLADQPKVADSNLPSPTAPVATAAMTPPPPVTPPAAAPTENVTAPAAPDVVKTAPVTRQARIANAPKIEAPPKSDVTQQATRLPPPAAAAPPAVEPAPVENQAAAIPEPASPAPPVNSVAGNPPLNEQSAAPETMAAPQAPAEQPAADQPLQ